MLESAATALGAMLNIDVLLMLVLGVLVGLVIGVIPGLGGTGAIALLLPAMFVLPPEQVLALMIGAIATVHTSDTITAVLIGVPGSAPSAVTVLDGHALARKGEASRALSIAFISSMLGGLIGAVGLTFSVPIARPLVMSFGAPELFMLTLTGVMITALLSPGRMVKGLIASSLGLLLGTVGTAPATVEYRYTFGTIFLLDGLSIVAVALGLFGIAEVIQLLVQRRSVTQDVVLKRGWLAGIRDVVTNWTDVVRGSLVGLFAGVLPGIGATAGAWMAYGQTVATSKDKKSFGKGNPKGIIAPESANNSVQAGDLVPTLLFGIPGAPAMALLLGVLLFFGIQPGPRLVTDNLSLLYTIVYSFVLATVLAAFLSFLFTKPLAMLTKVSGAVLGPALLTIMFVAAFQSSGQFGDLTVMLLLGVVGWLMKACGFPRACFLIAFVLSVPLERYYYLTRNIYELGEWATRPIVLVMAAILLLPPLYVGVRRLWRKRPPADRPDAADDRQDDSHVATTWPLVFSLTCFGLFAGALLLAWDFHPRARLAPVLVAGLGIVVSAIGSVRELHAVRNRATRVSGGSRNTRDVLLGFAGLLLFLTLVYVVGLIVAAAVSVPVVLLAVAKFRVLATGVYTAALVAGLLLVQNVIGVALPSGVLIGP